MHKDILHGMEMLDILFSGRTYDDPSDVLTARLTVPELESTE